MRVLVFGNPTSKIDSAAVKVAKRLSKKLPGVEFVLFDTAEDLERQGVELVIMDAVVGLKSPRTIKLEELELPANPLSLHGFDLIWNLLLLKKLGKVRSVTIIGIPANQPYTKSLQKAQKIISSCPAAQKSMG